MKAKYLIMMLALFIPQLVFAAPNATISTNVNSIENGTPVIVTVTLTDTAAWNIRLIGSGAATCSTKQADVTADGKSTTKNFTLSCTPTTEGTINFKVTGDITNESGQTKDISLTKDVNVIKAKSSNNDLSELKVDGVIVSGFTASKTTYILKDNSGSNINIYANPSDSKASVFGTGSKTLKYGKNEFNIVVTAENGAKKTYTIVVNKPDLRSTNNNLKSLAVDKGTIQFNKDTTTYTIKFEHDVEEIIISALAEDSKASVSGLGKKVLNDYANEFNIIVTAENDSTKTYVIKAIRKDKNGNYGKLNADNSVKSITITNYDFKFDDNQKKYNILVEENVEKLDIIVIPNNDLSTVSIQGNEYLKSGLNKVIVQVIAENGEINSFDFNIYKMGEEEKNEIGSVDTSSQNKNSKVNIIWLIISGLEFLIIVILILKLMGNNKNSNNLKNNEIQINSKFENEEINSINNSNNNLN